MSDLRARFKSCGKNVIIEEGVSIERPEVMEVGDHVRFGRGFVMIEGPNCCRIGANVTFMPNCFIQGTADRLLIADHVDFYPTTYISLGGMGGFVEIGHHSHFAPGCALYGHGGLTIGPHCNIAAHCVLATIGHDPVHRDKPMCHVPPVAGPITLVEDAWLGANVTVTSNVTIARGCVIGANAVVNRNTEPYGLYCGVPGAANPRQKENLATDGAPMNTDKMQFKSFFHRCPSVPYPWLILFLFLYQSTFAQAQFTVTTDFAGPQLVGFGAQMNPYLYCTPNQISGESAADFEKKVMALAPQHVRIFMLQHWFEDRADVISKGDPKTAESFIRVCRLAQDAGATINVTNWYGPWTEPEKQMANLAAIIDRLVNEEKLTAIQYVTIQNEPNLHEDKIKKELYATLYRSLDGELKKRNLRKQIKIISGDLVQDNQEAWFEHLAKNLSDVSDGYSIHAYWDYWDTPKILRRIRLPRQIVDAFPENQRRPLYVCEFGVRAHRPEPRVEPGKHEDGTPIADKPLQANQLAWFMLEGLNRGYVAFVIWTMEDAWYDRLMPYGLIGDVKDGWPLKPSYHMVRLFTHTAKPGWRALKVTGEHEGQLVSALRGPDGQFTLYALNQTTTPAKLTIAGVPSNATLDAIRWNAADDGKLSPGEPPNVGASGGLSLDLPPLSLTAVTTEKVSIVAPQ